MAAVLLLVVTLVMKWNRAYSPPGPKPGYTLKSQKADWHSHGYLEGSTLSSVDTGTANGVLVPGTHMAGFS